MEGEEEDQELDIFTPVTTNPAEEPNTVALLMREGVRRRGVTRSQCCTVLYYTVLYCTVLYCTVLYCTAVCYTVLY